MSKWIFDRDRGGQLVLGGARSVGPLIGDGLIGVFIDSG